MISSGKRFRVVVLAGLGITVVLLATLFSRYLATNLSQSLTDSNEALVGGKLKGELSSGEHMLTFRGRTNSGQVVEDSTTFTVGEGTPEPSPTPPPPGSTINIKDDLGATCDGEADDSPAFDAAVAQAAASTDITIHIPAGTCKITRPVFLPSNVTIQGVTNSQDQNAPQSVIYSPDLFVHMIEVGGREHVTIEHLTLTQETDDYLGGELTVRGKPITDIVRGGAGNRAKHITIRDNIIRDTTQQAIALWKSPEDVLVENNFLTNIGRDGVFIAGPAGNNITIRGNLIKRTGDDAIPINGHPSNVVIEDNTIVDAGILDDAANGIRLQGENILVRNNTITNSYTAGITVNVNPHNLDQPPRDITITDNVIDGLHDDGLPPASAGVQIRELGGHLTFTNNTVRAVSATKSHPVITVSHAIQGTITIANNQLIGNVGANDSDLNDGILVRDGSPTGPPNLEFPNGYDLTQYVGPPQLLDVRHNTFRVGKRDIWWLASDHLIPDFSYVDNTSHLLVNRTKTSPTIVFQPGGVGIGTMVFTGNTVFNVAAPFAINFGWHAVQTFTHFNNILTIPLFGNLGPFFSPPGFQEMGTYRGLGGFRTQVVGPGPTPGSERLYVSYSYYLGSAEIAAVDPATGEYDVYTVPNAHVWGLIPGPDGKVYLGTYPRSGGAKFYRIDPVARTLTELGKPQSPSEVAIWKLAVGTDGKIYGGTYPNAKLFRYDPASGALDDLGRMHPTEKYVNYVAADTSGFVYTRIGTVNYDIVAYEISTGQKQSVLPAAYLGGYVSLVRRGRDGKAYALVTHPVNTTQTQWFRLNGFSQPTPISPNQVSPDPSSYLQDGRFIKSMAAGRLIIYDPATQTEEERPFTYPGSEIGIFRLGLGPDGHIYASSALPANLVRIDPHAKQLTRIDTTATPLGNGEVYSFLPYDDKLYMAAYGSQASLMIYDPTQPYQPGPGENANPYRVPPLPETASNWRPNAMIAVDDKIYIGSVASYGVRGGHLTIVDPAARRMLSAHVVVPNQSVYALASWEKLVVGGTNVKGGSGTDPDTGDAHLFLWDTDTQQKVFDIVPVPGAKSINNLVTTPAGTVIGIARISSTQDTLFVFDPETQQVVHVAPLPSGMRTPSEGSAMGLGPDDGLVYGLYQNGIFTVNPSTYDVQVAATYNQGPINQGFAVLGNSLFFSVRGRIMQWVMP